MSAHPSNAGRPHRSTSDFVAGLAHGDRAVLAQAITLVESNRASDRAAADALLQAILPQTGKAHRIGITGVPGVGKSTTIDQLGLNLITAGHKVAVLAVDPTSSRTGGSILGDKTRMNRLSQDTRAFIRPSPTSGTLGGVARKTRETLALCEAAGFDVVIVETVGVGQSETTVADMVDIFVVLLLAGAGDDLQGIKKGIIELADIIAINKADGDNIPRATAAAAEYASALHILTPADAFWQPPVLTISGRDNHGLAKLWDTITAHRTTMTKAGAFQTRRQHQAVDWMRALLADRLLTQASATPALAAKRRGLESAVKAGTMTAPAAVDALLELMGFTPTAPRA
jgi:LAO/AO transport system kinase